MYSLSLQTDYNYNSGKSQIGVKVSDKDGELLTAKGYFDGSKKTYLQLPDISDTYFTMEGGALGLDPGAPVRDFSYDQKKMSASVASLTKIVDAAIDGGTVSIDKNSELSVENVDVKAEKVTVTLSGSQAEDLVINMLDDMKDDDYLYTFLSENYKNEIGRAHV